MRKLINVLDGPGWSKDEYDTMLVAAIEAGERATDQATHYGLTVMLMRRAMISALVVLDKDHPETAKRLLRDCLDKVEGDVRKRSAKIRAIRDRHLATMMGRDEGT